MIPIPGDSNKYTQPNNSDLFGVLHATKNVNLDYEGYISLASRTALIATSRDVANDNIGMITSFGRQSAGTFLAATTDEPHEISLTTSGLSVDPDTGTGNPALENGSRGVWFNSLWHATDDDDLLHRTSSSDTWTDAGITLTGGLVHALCPFTNKVSLAVSNGNTVLLLNTSYSTTVTLTIPSDYEVIGMAYSNNQMGIITRLGSSTKGKGLDAYFFTWDGASSSANGGAPIGSDAAWGICAYKGTFVVLTRAGQLLKWNGGGFDPIASFPSYFQRIEQGDLINIITKGDIMRVEGDVIYINMPADFAKYGPKQEFNVLTQPAGVWVYDPEVGLYHKYSGSNSMLTLVAVVEAGVNTTTNVITATSGTIAATGNPVKMVDGTIGGLTKNKVYYSIKASSTTFQLAESKDLALAGAAIDLTSVSGTSKFLFLDVVDYGSSEADDTGAIELMGSTNMIYDHAIFSSRFPAHTDSSSDFCVCISVPDFKNIGYFVTSRIQASAIKDTWQRLFAHIRPLLTGERIIIKTKSKEFQGIPVSINQFDSTTVATWTGARELYSTGDFSEAYEQFNNDVELEMEILSGAGAGQMSKITDMGHESGTYSFTLEDALDGVVAGRPCTFRVDNWETSAVITSESSSTADGILDEPLKPTSPWVQIKVIMEGSDLRMGSSRLFNEPSER